MQRLLFSIITFLSFLPLMHAQSMLTTDMAWERTDYPKRETRAVWLGTIGGIDWPRHKVQNGRGIEAQKQELRNMLDELERVHINTVILQTRIRGTVIYPSDIEPWDDCMTGRKGIGPGYDPLAFAIDECHKRGMELHAWVVCIPVGSVQKQKAYGSQSILKRQPKLCKISSGEVFMQPSQPGTATYIASICREIAQRYDIDGISLDYIRYPEAMYHFTDKCTPTERRANITRIVQAVHDQVKAIKPWVKLSSSPIGKHRDLSRYTSRGWNCYDAVWQEPQEWLKKNLQDMLFPMMYFQGDHFYPFLYDWQENAYGHPVIPGLGIYFLSPTEGRWELNDVRAQLYTARRSGIGGFCFYRSEFLVRNCKGLYDCVADELDPYPALTCRMTWMGDTLAPSAPTQITLSGSTLSWTPADTSEWVCYNLYASDTYPVDVDRAENLVKARILSTSLPLPAEALVRRYYAVTAQDRYGNESAPIQEPERKLNYKNTHLQSK